MKGRDLLLILTHLFRMKGKEVPYDVAAEFLSFRCRFGPPSEIRELIELAAANEMISRKGNIIEVQFLFDRQNLLPNLTRTLT